MNYELAKDFYYRELDSRVEQNKRTQGQSTLLALIGGALFYIIRETWIVLSILDLIVLMLSMMAISFFTASVLYLLFATIGYKYEKLPKPSILHAYYLSIMDYHNKNNAEGSPDNDMENYLIRKMVSAATTNERNSYSRSALYYRSSQCIVVSVIILMVAGVLKIMQMTYS